jgi:hypothetical protein
MGAYVLPFWTDSNFLLGLTVERPHGMGARANHRIRAPTSKRPRKLPREILSVLRGPVYGLLLPGPSGYSDPLLSRETAGSLINPPVTKLIIQATRRSRSLSNRIAFGLDKGWVDPCPWNFLLPHRRAGPRASCHGRARRVMRQGRARGKRGEERARARLLR